MPALALNRADWLAIEREACRRSLATFCREAWHVLEPSTPLRWGWALDAVCEHMQAVTDGHIRSLLINIPPGPMRADSLVETARGMVRLDEVKIGDLVLTHRGRYRAVEAVHDQGVLPILRIVTNSGRETFAAPSHPYLTPSGWVKAGELQVGDVLAVVNPSEDARSGALTNEEARFLGYIVGDGAVTHSPSFVNSCRETIDDFRSCAEALGFETSERKSGTFWTVGIRGAREFLDRHQLLGKNSYTKRAPKAVMAASREAARNFLGAYWSCDGGIDVRASRSRGSIYRAYATTVSRKLAEDLLHLLGLVGIEARLRAKARALETAAQPGGVYRSFTIDVGSEAMTARVVRLPGMSSVKRTRGEACQIDFDRPIWNDTIVSIGIDEPARCMCLTVAEDHSFTCSGIAVKNCMKSLLVGVLWPAWEWGPRGLKHLRYLGTAHKQDLATRDNMKCRRLVSSKWFQERWPIVLMNDNNAKLRFENSATGFREAMAFTSMTGSRGDRVILDDPLSVDDADSEAALKAAELTFTEALPTRVNSEQSAKIVIMQRLHERDTSGVILSRALDYVHLMLPMEFEPERRCVTSIGFSDPRKAAGELLFPERFGPEQVADLKRTMGQYAVSGQFQQRPAPRDGGRFKRQWFEVVDALPANRRRVRRWDFAGTEATQGTDPDWTVGLLMSAANGVYYVEDVVRDRCSPAGVETMVRNTATADGKAVPIRIPQDPGAAGKSVALSFVKALAGWDIRAKTETGSKTDRARPLEAQAEAGNVKLLRGHWNQVFLDELCVFPGGAHDDQVDAASGAFAELLETPPTPLFGTYGND